MHTYFRIQKILEPLAIAANVSQVAHTQLDHVLLTLGNLVYSTQMEAFDEDIRLGILKSLEKRWKKADQDIFVVAVFLNPFIRATLFKKEFLTEAQLYTIVERVYVRVMRCSADEDLDFLQAFEDYKWSRGEFSDDSMSLSLMKKKFANAVRAFPVCLAMTILTENVLEYTSRSPAHLVSHRHGC